MTAKANSGRAADHAGSRRGSGRASLRGDGFGPAVVGFAGWTAHHLGDADEGPRHFIGGENPADVSGQGVVVHACGSAVADEFDDGDDLAAPTLTGPSDDQYIAHAGVTLERSFDFLGKDLLAAGVDHPRVASVQVNQAVNP